jgi:hypothetical protein
MMHVIPWRDFPDFTQTLRLSGDLFSLRSRWNETHQFWTLDIYDKNGQPLIIGQKIVFNTDLLARYKNPLLPAGKMFVIDSSTDSQSVSVIGRNDFGVNVFLVYEE